MADILVIGSLNADLVVRTPRLPVPGETIQGEDLVIIPGGKGANQAIAAARQGAEVAMAGRVGSDSFGTTLVENLQHNHVDTSHILTDEGATGTAIIAVDAAGQNSILLSPGANGKVIPADVDTLDFQEVKVLLLQFEIPLESVMHAAVVARQHGVRVLLNPAPAQPVPDALLTEVDILIPNESELASLTGMPVRNLGEVESAGRSLLSRGLETLVITLGADGALIISETLSQHIPGYRVEVVDTTAAGDAFIGGLSVDILNGNTLEEAVRRANACGALAATRFGAQPSLPTSEQVDQLMSQTS
jgi:ribokinase